MIDKVKMLKAYSTSQSEPGKPYKPTEFDTTAFQMATFCEKLC